MSLFQNHYYQINTFFLSCTGQWPYQSSFKNILIRIVGYTSLIITMTTMISHIFLVWGDLDACLDTIPPLFIVLTSFSTFTVCIYKQQEILEILECMENDWKIWSSGPELEILKSYGEEARYFSILYAGNIYVTVTTFITMSCAPLILDILIPLNESRPHEMVYPGEYFVDHDKYYNWIFLQSSLSVICNLTLIVGCESMYVVSIQHACALFAIISHRLRNVMEELECIASDQKQCKHDALYKYMTFSIERHNYAIRFANILESCYSPTLFLAMGFNMLETSVVGLQTVLSLGDIDKTIKYGTFTMGVIIHIYLISLPAQKLIEHSTAVAHNLYDGTWYLMPLKAKKLLGMIIMKASIPKTLTALKFFSVNIITFSSILKTSFSYFTMLTSVRN